LETGQLREMMDCLSFCVLGISKIIVIEPNNPLKNALTKNLSFLLKNKKRPNKEFVFSLEEY